jgi:hypothetical protein
MAYRNLDSRPDIAKASSPSRAASRPPQDEEAFLRLGLILRCEAIAEPRRIEAKPELIL